MVHSLEVHKKLFYRLLRLRLIEEAIATRYSEWKMRCPVHLSIGQEAVSIGVGAALEKDDFAVSGHRAHGHYLGKGGDLKRMIAEIYGKKTGCSGGNGGSMHLIDESVGFKGSTAIVGGTIPIGVGLGLSIQLEASKKISCIFFGEGATEEGVFFESVNFAVLKKLPVLFVCENNFYSVYSPLHVRQPLNRSIHQMVQAMGLPSHAEEGNEVSQVYSTATSAIQKIRDGQGPQFLEFFTYRWREHCGPNYDDHLGYRPPEEVKRWKDLDPLLQSRKKLLQYFPQVESELAPLEEEIQKEIQAAFDFAEHSPYPTLEEAKATLYSSGNKTHVFS